MLPIALSNPDMFDMDQESKFHKAGDIVYGLQRHPFIQIDLIGLDTVRYCTYIKTA